MSNRKWSSLTHPRKKIQNFEQHFTITQKQKSQNKKSLKLICNVSKTEFFLFFIFHGATWPNEEKNQIFFIEKRILPVFIFITLE